MTVVEYCLFIILVIMSSIMVFRPSKEEFHDFKKYINFIEAQGASKSGIAKVSLTIKYCMNKYQIK